MYIDLLEIKEELWGKIQEYTFAKNGNDYSNTIKNLIISVKIIEDIIDKDTKK